MKRISFGPLILVLLATVGALGQLKLPQLGDREAGGAVAKEDGKVRWKNHWTMDHASSGGKPAIHFLETGQGKYTPFSEEVRWSTESWWSADSVFRPLRFDKTFTDTAGKPLVKETEEFDWKKHEARFERKDLRDGKTTTKTFEVPDDTLSVEGIAAALRAVPPDEKKFQAHLLSNEPKLYDVTIEARGKESCRTAAGSVDCYKLELVPHLGALDLFRFAFPKSYFWYSSGPKREWLRYEGLEAGRGTPEIVMEPEG